MKRKLKYITVIISLLITTVLTGQRAIASSSLLISEISMGSASSATEEFIELYNNSNASISLNGYSIYYRSATGSNYLKKASIGANTSVLPHSFFLISTSTSNNSTLISGMAQTGGVVELRDDKGVVIDRVGYGNATASNGKPATAAQAGESIYRQYDSSNLAMVNTDDNFSDFYIASTPSPGSVPALEIEEIAEPISYPDIFINEIYPNPTNDQSESEDEFIELYNPNDFAVDLNGWQIKDSSGKTFIVKNSTISAFGFVTFYSSETDRKSVV